MSVLDQLRAQNTRTVHLLLQGDAAVRVPAGTPAALAFRLARVNARDIRHDLVYAALGRDGYAAYAAWYNAQGQQHLAQRQANSRRPDEPEEFKDDLPDDASWRAHSLAIEAAVQTELLTQGMLDPTYQDAGGVLGPYAPALVLELVQWTRDPPAWHPPGPLPEDATPEQIRQAEENDTSGKLSSGPSVPP